MNGYINNEEATRATIDEEGWMHSGDIGFCDQDGFFSIVDRAKDLIKVKAFQVGKARNGTRKGLRSSGVDLGEQEEER